MPNWHTNAEGMYGIGFVQAECTATHAGIEENMRPIVIASIN
jgi:hypothetical protein